MLHPAVLVFTISIIIYMNSETLLRLLIREELGRNIRSIPDVDAMQNWRHLDGIDAQVTADPGSNGWHVKISTADGKVSLPLKYFSDENSANFWAREQDRKSVV